MGDFDFDYWRELAKNDPSVYFRVREATINGYIEACPERVRPHLRQTQDRIDALRACSGSPLCATCQMMALIDASLRDMCDCLDEVRREVRAL